MTDASAQQIKDTLNEFMRSVDSRFSTLQVNVEQVRSTSASGQASKDAALATLAAKLQALSNDVTTTQADLGAISTQYSSAQYSSTHVQEQMSALLLSDSAHAQALANATRTSQLRLQELAASIDKLQSESASLAVTVTSLDSSTSASAAAAAKAASAAAAGVGAAAADAAAALAAVTLSARDLDTLTATVAALQAKMCDAECVKVLIAAAVDRLSADKLYQPDYALHSRGACVVADTRLTSPTYNRSSQYRMDCTRDVCVVVNEPGSPVDGRQTPLAALHPSLDVGMCWPMAGPVGNLTVLLAEPVHVSGVSIDHAHPSLAHDASTPKLCSVWAYKSLNDASPVRLTSFEYSPALDGQLRTATFNRTQTAYQLVQLRVESNHAPAHAPPGATCLYRFRVHGQPKDA